MPYKNFKCIEPSQEILNKIFKTKSNSKIGNLIEIDLEYSDCIKDITKYYRLVPIKDQ